MGRLFFFAFIFVVVWSSIFLNPRGEDQTRTSVSHIAAPLPFVRQRVLDFDYIRGLQLQSQSGVIMDSFQLERHGKLSAVENARPGDTLRLTNSTGGQRTATVVAKSVDQLIFREDRPWAQRVYHNLTFYPDDGTWEDLYGETVTSVSYQRQWKGMPLLFWMRFLFPSWEPWIGEGLPKAQTDLGLGHDVIWGVQSAWQEIERARLDRVEAERGEERAKGPKTLSWKASRLRDLEDVEVKVVWSE